MAAPRILSSDTMISDDTTDQATTAIALFSGGLDSILACRIVAEQGVRVKAIKFVTPFFGYDLLSDKAAYTDEANRKFGVDAALCDVSAEYLDMLRKPLHGFGKHFNPCIDCKILLLRRARQLMEQLNASFLLTGEVVGQRPMSQRRDTLRVIERDSGCEGLLLRPLCARNLPPTEAELNGLVDREKLLDLKGRGRGRQIELAERFDVHDYPNPAGGCVLTDPNLSKRIRLFFEDLSWQSVADMRLAQLGRQFLLPGNRWIVVGRNEAENDKITALRQAGDVLFRMVDRPGPTALLRYGSRNEFMTAAGLVVRYGRKGTQGESRVTVEVVGDDLHLSVDAGPLTDAISLPWKV